MGGIVAGEGRDRGGLCPRPPFLAPRQEEKYSILLLPCLVKRPPIYKGRRKRARARRTGSSASVRPPASSEVVHVSRLSPAGRALPPFSSTSIVIANLGGTQKRGHKRTSRGYETLGISMARKDVTSFNVCCGVCVRGVMPRPRLSIALPHVLCLYPYAHHASILLHVWLRPVPRSTSLSLSLLLYSHTTTALECC